MLLCWSLCVLSLAVRAQDKPVKFGVINSTDLEMKAYPADSSAEALLLYDYGETEFVIVSNEICIRFTYHGRIKIFKKSAYEKATVSIRYHTGSHRYAESVTNVKGFTYNLENGVIKKESLNKDMIFNERSSDTHSTQRFTLPNVKEGSVVEYSYQVLTPLSYYHNPKTWTFQGSMPVAWSEYRITIPNSLYYRMIMSGYLPLHISENKPINIDLAHFGTQGMAYRFVVKDAPAFQNEPYITTPGDYVSKVDFELARINIPGTVTKNYSISWNDLNSTLLSSELLGGQISRTSFMKDIAKKIQAQAADTTAQLEAAVKYIQQQVKWNGYTSIYSKNLKKILETREGDSGDINLLLIALLREMGYDANPLVLSTRQNGRLDTTYAMLKQFNNVVAHLDLERKDVLLDATDEFLKLGMVPTYCLNQAGWLVHRTKARFVPIRPTESDREFEKAELIIGEDGELKGTFTKSYGGYSGWSAKKTLKTEGPDKFLEAIQKENPSWSITKHDFKNYNELNQSMDATYELSMTDYVTQAGNMLYLRPMLSEGYAQNPLKADTRAYPVDYGHPIEEVFVATYQVPAGYAVVEHPKTAVVTLPDNAGRFMYVVNVADNKVTVTSRVVIRKTIHFAEEYSALKMFYDQIIAKHNEQIVLKKGN
ncbi:hypothetical protein GCM10027275_01800 [Rhabdobacter roseus]